MKHKHKIGMGLVCLIIAACVTVNIYFPAAKAEKAAEEIVKEVRGKQPSSKTPKVIKNNKPQSWHWRWPGVALAYADEAALKVSNASIRALKASIKKRYPQLKPFLAKGYVGENNQGFVEIRNWKGLNLIERAQLKRLVEAENKDRKLLYQEVAKALNIAPSQLPKLQQIFAKQWQKTSPEGTWIQQPDGSWIRKQ